MPLYSATTIIIKSFTDAFIQSDSQWTILIRDLEIEWVERDSTSRKPTGRHWGLEPRTFSQTPLLLAYPAPLALATVKIKHPPRRGITPLQLCTGNYTFDWVPWVLLGENECIKFHRWLIVSLSPPPLCLSVPSLSLSAPSVLISLSDRLTFLEANSVLTVHRLALDTTLAC